MKYFKSILLMGWVIPIVLACCVGAVVIVGCLGVLSKIAAKEAAWQDHKARLVQIDEIQTRMKPLALRYKADQAILSEDIQSSLVNWLDREAGGKIGDQLVRQGVEFPSVTTAPRTGGKAQVAQFPSRPLSMNFSGRYAAMQTLLMDVETKFPQLKLQEFTFTKADPTASVPSEHLDFRFGYTALTKETKQPKQAR